jgi:hypothetical protein
VPSGDEPARLDAQVSTALSMLLWESGGNMYPASTPINSLQILAVAKASWMFIPGEFFTVPAMVSPASSLNRFGKSVSMKYSKDLNSVPPNINRVRRRKMFFVVSWADGEPTISNCGWSSTPN